MSATKKYSVLSISNKLFCQSTSSSSSSIFRLNTTASRASVTSDNSDQYKGKYAEQALPEGDTKGYDTSETAELDEDKNEASEMGEKARESTERGLENAKHFGEEMEDVVEEKIAESIGDEAKQAMQAAWNTPKDEETIDYGEDENMIDKEHMKKLAKAPGGKPSEELDILDVSRRPLAEKKS